jgi:inner membrane protein
MIFKTHLALNYLVLQSILKLSDGMPEKILTPWGIGTIIGTTIGTFVPDIDAPHSEVSKRLLPAKTLLNLLLPILSIFSSLALSLFIYSKTGLNYMYDKIILFFIILMTLFLILSLLFKVLLKSLFVHRGFLHSIWGLLIINFFLSIMYINNLKTIPLSFINMYNGFYIGMNIGYLGHLIGDMMTFHGINPLFPIKWKISLKIFRTNSLEEKIFMIILIIVNIIFFLANIFKV